MTSKIVILGGSFAAHFAITALSKLPNDFEVTVVAPNTHSYFNVSAPRLLVEPDNFEKVVFSNADFVQKKLKNASTFVQGKAVSIHFDDNKVTVETADGEKVLSYDILVIATGTATKFHGWKVNESHLLAKSAIEEAAQQIKAAKSIAVVGGGPTGVETAGEIAHNNKGSKVTLYTGLLGPLSAFPTLVDGASAKLKALGVEVVNEVRSKSIEGNTIHLDSGESRTFDLVIDSSVHTPNSDFVPQSAKDESGFVVTDRHLVVEGTTNVVALGDIISGAAKTIVDIKLTQIGIFTSTIKKLTSSGPQSKEYTPNTSTILVPISPSGGVGIIFGWGVPNFVVRLLKAKSFFLDKAGEDLS